MNEVLSVLSKGSLNTKNLSALSASFLCSSCSCCLSLIIPCFFGGEVPRDGSLRLFKEAGATFLAEPARVDPSILRAFLWLLAILPVLHHLRHRFVREVLIEPLVVHLDHRGIDAGSEALDLLQREETVSARLIISDIIEVLDGLNNFSGLSISIKTIEIRHMEREKGELVVVFIFISVRSICQGSQSTNQSKKQTN